MSFNAFSNWMKQKQGQEPSALSKWMSQKQPEINAPKPVDEVDEKTLPFGAKGVTKDGMAYYGEGVHGWIRKTYGDLFDPSKRLLNADDADYEKYNKYASQFANMVDTKFNWDEWGENVFGLSSREAGNALASIFAPGKISRENLQEQVDAGELTQTQAFWQNQGNAIANAVNMTKDVAQRSIWGVLEVFGITDTGMRKAWGLRLGVDDLADKYGEKDKGGFWSQFNPIGQTKDALTVLSAVVKGDASLKDIQKIYSKENKYLTASNAIYTLASDEEVRREFNRRVDLGEDAGFVAAELARPGLEFAGSILGDPATYLGMGIFKPSLVGTPMKLFGKEVKVFGVTQRVPWQKIGRIPSFGEMLHLGVAGTRLEKAADNHFFSFANKELARLTQNAFDAGDEVTTLRLLDEGIAKVIKPAETALEEGKGILKTGIGDLTSTNILARKSAFKNSYKITSLTSSDKARMVAKNMSLVVDMLHGGSKSADETLEVLKDMAAMQSAGSTQSRINAAKRLLLKGVHNADGTVTGHGALLFSEAGIMTGDMLSRLSPGKLDELFMEFGKDKRFGEELYKVLDNTLQEVFPSVDEMYDAKKALKAGDTSQKVAELAQKYEELPQHVKAMSAIHSKTRKAQAAVVGAQVNLYMKWNPGYATRNITGQGIGIAMEMGLGRAITTSLDAIWKPIVSVFSEALGKTAKVDPVASHMAFRAQQVVDATGVVPESLWRAMGMAEVKNAKGFNALNAAQKGEALTGADIVAETVFDELQKALPAVLSDEASIKTLVDTGVINDKQASLLVKLMTDYNGNTDKAISVFKKSITDARVESWRHIPIPKGVQDILRKTGGLGEIQALQENAKSLDEFTEGAKNILQNIYDTVKKNAASETPSIDSNVPQELREAVDEIVDMFNDGLVDDREADFFTRKVQAWQNVRSYLEESSRMLERELYNVSVSKGINSTKFTTDLTASAKKFDSTYKAVGDVRFMARKTIDDLKYGKITVDEAFRKLKHSNLYDIRNYFPDVDPAKLSPREAIDHIWSSYFQFSGEHWRNANNAKYTESMTIFQKWAEATGQTLDDVASMHNLPSDPMLALQKAYREAEMIESMGAPSIDKFRDVGNATLQDMIRAGDQFDASGKPFSRKRIFNTVNAERKAQGLQPYATYADVPFKEAQNAMKSRMSKWATPAEVLKKVNANLDEGVEPFTDVKNIPDELLRSSVEAQRLPPPLNQEYVTTARAYLENMDGFMEDASNWTNNVVKSWGKLDDAGELPENIELAMGGWKKVVDDRMRHVKDRALVIASSKRDFLLHDYAKTYGDVALAHLMPFSYWHTRTYTRMAERVVDSPKWANWYMAYRRKNEQEHAEDPAWWRNNVGIKIPGMNHGNPVFVNLEAAINPMNGLTGVDFNDPYKRVDWLSKTVDDMGKMGPSFTSPINWAVALWLYSKGEEEASKRWLGRAIPITTQIKGLLTKAGADINLGPFVRHNELDPFVNFTSTDGLDPYELNRVNRHLSALVEQEQDPEKRQLLATQAVDAARLHEGELWDRARENAISERAPGNLSSWLLGVGFKPRTEEDMRVDQFYGEYFKLIQMRDAMSTSDYRESWDKLRDAYPFADSLIIGKKSDPERDGAFSYNVLGRIPPGQMTDILEQVGLTNEDVNHFYESKGDFSEWTEGDYKRFIAATVDLSAILQLPDTSTRQEWNAAKTSYEEMQTAIEGQLGGDIWDKVETYYTFKNDSRYKGNTYLHDHPEVSAALDMQTQIKVNNPLLYQYYGSLDTLQSYYNGEVRKELEKKYGEGIYEAYYAYLDAPDNVSKKQVLAQTPGLKEFIKEKSKFRDPVNRAVVSMALKLPDQPEFDYRADLTSPTPAQMNLINTMTIPSGVDPQELWSNSSQALQYIVNDYWTSGGDLPSAARSNLEYLGEQYGITADEALQTLGLFILQGQQ